MPKLVIIRGIPGSGKSTAAEELFRDFIHLEADMFFLDADGNYNYDRTLATAAHDWCAESAEKFLHEGRDVVVTNTFIFTSFVSRYQQIAERTGAKFFVLTSEHRGQNIHNVPVERVRSMWQNFERW